MSIKNPLQFAVVREDPLVDLLVIKHHGLRKVLLVASGGCTALSLAHYDKGLDIHVFDPNPAQIAHTKKKMQLTNSMMNHLDKLAHLTLLNEAGNFESLFRGFRNFISEHIADKNCIEQALRGSNDDVEIIISNCYWPIAFELFFNKRYLEVMFGPNAVQHAPKCSYPEYFKQCLERGLKEQDRETNYFLHHIFLGKYLNDSMCLPIYMKEQRFDGKISFNEGYLSDVSNVKSFDYVMLSNIFDWMDENEIDETIQGLKEMAPGSVMLYRQINNERDIIDKLSPYFIIDKELSKQLLDKDRSLFYSQIIVAKRK